LEGDEVFPNPDSESMEMLVGEEEEQRKGYLLKLHEIRMDLVKQKLQKALYTPATGESEEGCLHMNLKK
jgi:hypothetical protein